ncbi:type II toxin-antitoxin system VapC family toxin [Actinoplanes sp. NPDC051633]|uniref:type II toxin-antitoxin system VapC family toxin n=1 Tax=Actinoplanes sp. NPDC051633 TaxID=3155670 RepID=UPI0034496190
MSLVVLDTDVASAILRGRLPDRLRARLTGKTSCITLITLGELTTWTVIRSWAPRKLAELAHWRAGVSVLPFDEQVATTWGLLQANAQLRGRSRPVNDTWIAASCLVERLPLATFNTKDFLDFAEHHGLRLFDVS